MTGRFGSITPHTNLKQRAMNSPHPKQCHATSHRAVVYSGAIEWEEMPSMGRREVMSATT